MDQELKEYLGAMEARMDAKLDEKLGALEARTDEKLEALESRLKEHVETVETRLLSEFWKWARSADIKSRQQSEGIHSLDQRLAVVEERLTILEMRRPH